MKRFYLLAILISLNLLLNAQKRYAEMTLSEKRIYDEHIFAGQPGRETEPVYIRHGYVLKYNEKYRIPDWVAYHITPEYLKTPKRERQYSKFRTDPDMRTKNPVQDRDYVDTEYSRGHIAPYFAMGGDRDKNGLYPNIFSSLTDPYDDTTIFQANYLSNIAPQDQDALNGAGGPWYALETKIRNVLVGKNRMELNVIAGCIVSDSVNFKTMCGKYGNAGIAIPDKFYQIIIYHDKNGHFYTGAFLFPHVKKRKDLPYPDLIQYLVPVDSLEKLTRFDFFKKLSPSLQKKIESLTNRDFWIANGLN